MQTKVTYEIKIMLVFNYTIISYNMKYKFGSTTFIVQVNSKQLEI
jgi:hypothetical protein